MRAKMHAHLFFKSQGVKALIVEVTLKKQRSSEKNFKIQKHCRRNITNINQVEPSRQQMLINLIHTTFLDD